MIERLATAIEQAKALVAGHEFGLILFAMATSLLALVMSLVGFVGRGSSSRTRTTVRDLKKAVERLEAAESRRILTTMRRNEDRAEGMTAERIELSGGSRASGNGLA